MGNLAYNSIENIYLLHDGASGPQGDIMEGCCCGGGPCEACGGCITVVVDFEDRFLLQKIPRSSTATKCHSLYSLVNADGISPGHTVEGDTLISVIIIVTAIDMYVRIIVNRDGYVYRNAVVTARAPGPGDPNQGNYGCAAWNGKKVEFGGSGSLPPIQMYKSAEGGDCESPWSAEGTADVRVYFGPPGEVDDTADDGTAGGTLSTYKVLMNGLGCDGHTGTTPWDGIVTLNGSQWTFNGSHYGNSISVVLDFDVTVGAYHLKITCDTTSQVLVDAHKTDCGGPDGDYGGITVEVP